MFNLEPSLLTLIITIYIICFTPRTLYFFNRKCNSFITLFRSGGDFRIIDIIDTSGSYQFPAMRKLNIESAHAHAVVYSVDDMESYLEAMRLVNLIKETRGKGRNKISGRD